MNTIYTLQNKYLKAVFKPQGAELISLTKNETEYIWQGNPEFWNRQAPVLFPFVGAEKNNSYIYNNVSYSIGQHGFARDKNFTVVSQDDNSIVFGLKPDEDSKTKYPFDFTLQLKYTLTNDGLTTAYSVQNPSDQDLYFSIGGHPAFNCPFEKEQTREEYILMFDNDANPESQLFIAGLATDEHSKVFKQGGILELSKTIFDKGAIVFNPNPFSEVSFIHQPTGKTYMSVEFKNFPFLGVWSASKEAPFVCIEPWHGIADHVNHNQKLTEKKGIIRLATKENFNCEYSILINSNNV